MASEELKYLDDLTAKQQKDAQKNYEAVKKELEEVTSNKNDVERSIDQKVLKKSLDGSLGEALERNPDLLNNLMKTVEELLNDNINSLVAGKDHLNNLKQYFDLVKANANKRDAENKNIDNTKEYDKFYGDVSDKQRMETDFQTFAGLLRNGNTLKRLSEMQDSQIRRVQRYLETHEDQALDVYNKMKIKRDYNGNIKGEGYGNEDNRYFNAIWSTLQDKYKESDKFLENDYGKLDATSQSLKNFLKNKSLGKWNGDNISLGSLIVLNSIVSREFAKDRFNLENKKRKDSNKSKILDSSFDYDSLQISFKDGKLSGKNVDLTSENIADYLMSMNAFGSELNFDGTDFVDNDEKKDDIKKCGNELYNRILSDLRAVDIQSKTNGRMQLDKQKIGGGSNVFAELQKLSDNNLKFIEKDNANNYIFLPDKAANYLSSLKSVDSEGIKSRNELKNLRTENGQRQLWIAAVQVLLNNDVRLFDSNENLLVVDGKLEENINDRTFVKIKRFQKEEGFSVDASKKGKGFGIDGRPGPNTINALIGRQESISAKENVNSIVAKLSLEKIKSADFLGFQHGFGINAPIDDVYKKGENDVYFVEGKDFYKISVNQPWVKVKQIMEGENVTDGDTVINVCEGGASKLNELVSSKPQLNNFDGYTFGKGEKNYILSKGNVVSNLDNDFFTKPFCGLNKIEDKLALLYVEQKLREKGYIAFQDLNEMSSAVMASGLSSMSITFSGDAFLNYYNGNGYLSSVS